MLSITIILIVIGICAYYILKKLFGNVEEREEKKRKQVKVNQVHQNQTVNTHQPLSPDQLEAKHIRENYMQTNVLTPTELIYYKSLRQELIDYNVEVHYKIRLADIFQVKYHNQYYNTNFYRIMAKHVDFLIVKPDTAKPLIAIELDDASHEAESSFKNDNFKNIIFNASDILLLRVKVKSQYDFTEIKIALQGYKKEIDQANNLI